MISIMLVGCLESPNDPTVEKGEFDFSVTYEINGEVKTVSGVYVCEYDGVSWALDGGPHRSWTGYCKGLEDDLIRIGTTADGQSIDLDLNLYPEYFMGDIEENYREPSKPYIVVTVVGEDGGIGFAHEPDEVEELCGAKIISYTYEEPIVNSFD